MKHLKTIFACLLMAVLSIGQVWAVESNFTDKNLSVGEGELTWTASPAFSSFDTQNGRGPQSAKASTEITMTSAEITGTITSVVVTASTNGTSALSISIDGNAFGGDAQTITSGTAAKNSPYEFTGSATVSAKPVIVSITRTNCTVWIKSITVTYTTGGGGGSDPTLSLDPQSKEFETTGNSAQTIALTASNFSSDISSVTCAFYSEATCATSISRPSWVNEPTVNDTKTQVSVNVSDNDGAARQTWMKITASDGSDEASAVFAISQKALVVDFATLPFAFDGGKADIETTNGMTQGSLDNSDYSASPKLKFKNQGSWVIIKINADPGTLTYDIKGNSMSGTYAFDVEQSTDGETYSNVTTHTSLSGSKESKEFTLNQTTRFVRFVYTTKASGNVGLGNIAISEYVAPAAVATPVISGDDPFLTETEVSITCETAGATIYYTTTESAKGTPATSGDWIAYDSENKPSFNATTTVWAAAIKGSDWSSVAEKTFTKTTALTTMDEIFAAATTTATPQFITFSSSWVVTGVSTNGKNVYITDGTKGMILYNNGANMGLVVGNTLSGTVQRSLKLYNGSAQLDAFTPEGLTIGTGSQPAVQELDATGIEALSGANTGSLIKISGECSEESGKFKIGGVQLYNSLYSFSVSAGTSYECTGVYVQYNTNTANTKEILPRSAADIVETSSIAVTGVTLTESSASVEAGETVTLHATVDPSTATNKTIVWSVQSGDDKASVDENGVVTGIEAGTAVIRAASDEDATLFAECTVTVTEPAPLSPWATVYTSNVELSGSQNVKVTITVDEEDKNFDGVKMNKAAAATFTIPAGTTNLYAHMAAWNGEAQTVTVSGDCFDADKSIDIVADANISGSGTTYDIDDAKAPTDYFKEIVLDKEVTEPTEITITAASGKRFVLFGVNQVGGLVLESIAISGTATELEYNEGDHFDPAGLKVMGHYSDNSDAEITEGIDWAFDPDPLTEGTTSVSVTATAGGFTSDAFVVNGLTVNGAAPLSPWASVYTSNVEIASNTAAHVTINEENFDAAKTSKGASATITLPQGVTTIHLHLVAWKDEAQTVSVTGDCFNEAKNLSIIANDGVSGSGTTYALGESGVDYYFSLTPDKEVAANTVITITAASGKRFVLFGVNQEGGVLPVLESIEISGDLSTKTGYKVGDALDLDGLTVEATYSIGGVAQTPVDITDKLGDGLTLTYDPLVENQTEVTITATYGDKSDDITITGLDPVASADPAIYVDPSLTVNFGSVEVGEAVPANKTITVTLTNVAAATATLGGTNPEAFSIDKTALVDGDVITISVIASTAAAASYSATITITDDAAAATEKVVNLSFAVTEPVVEESPVSTTSKWVAATDADLVDGKEVLITGVKDEVTYAIGEQNDNNRAAVAGTLSEGVFTPGANTMSFTLVAQDGGKFALRASNGEYLYAASSSKNYLKRQATIDDNAKWTLTATSAVANGTNTHNDLKFNGTNSPKIFSCYTGGQTAIQFYVPKPVEPVYTEVRTGLEVNRHYTVCLEKNITAIDGATFWSMSKCNTAGTEAYLEEVTDPEAGKPYIIQATKTVLKVVYGETVAADPVENGALRGTFTGLNASQLNAINEDPVKVYMLFNNELRPIGTNNHLDAHRAYVLYNELDPVSEAPQSAPGKRVKGMPMQKDAATGIEDLNASEKPMKMMINGQIFILRGEKMYDTTGRLVK